MFKRILPVIIIILAIIGIIYLMSEPVVKEESTKVETTPPPANGLQIKDTKVGDGQEVKKGDEVIINYTGTLEDGTKFDSSFDTGKPFETKIGVGEVIEGWDQGVVGMKVGGERHLVIPPSLGYGDQGVPPKIPPNSTLIFDVQLLGIK
jgi:peptidylprolyl isomerase